MKLSGPALRERIQEKCGEYFDEFWGEIESQLASGRDVTFRMSAKITSDYVEYSASAGIQAARAQKTSDKLDDPNQEQFEAIVKEDE